MKKLHEKIIPAYPPEKYPIKILQVGEGIFLRGFFDWMIQESAEQGNFSGSIAVTNPRCSGREKLELLKSHKGMYTVLMKGIKNGEIYENNKIITVFSKFIDPYSEWENFLALAHLPELEFVISNTTEAGIQYKPLPFTENMPLESFPSKLAALLYKRFNYYQGDSSKGLIMLPCELIDQNGDRLKEIVLQHCEDWKLPKAFILWVKNQNLFLNSLVDRIVSGFPENNALEIFSSVGYEDALLTVAEPYHLWAIQGDKALDNRLPLQKSGLNVSWVNDLTPYQIRKVRILNGTHILMTHLGMLMGFEEVEEAISDQKFGQFIQSGMAEIIDSLELASDESWEYARGVVERFKNPFLHHKLASISLNGTSKFKVRVLPSLEVYTAKNNKTPAKIVRSLAALIRFYKTEKLADEYIGKGFYGNTFTVQDNEQTLAFFNEQWRLLEKEEISFYNFVQNVLGNKNVWETDLNKIPDLTNEVLHSLSEMEEVK